jgi:hypothetical protein
MRMRLVPSDHQCFRAFTGVARDRRGRLRVGKNCSLGRQKLPGAKGV